MLKNLFKKGAEGIRSFGSKLRALLSSKIDPEAIEKLEQLFYEADFGSEISQELASFVEKIYRKNPSITLDEVFEQIRGYLLKELQSLPLPPPKAGSPHVILIVGVNGNGKTTTIAKLAKWYIDQRKKVLLAAADTFRAAAIEQLQVWSQRLNLEIVKGKDKGDPAAVAFDAISSAKSRGYDIVLIDTAGRLHTKSDLMRELSKISTVSNKAHMGAPHETLLVLDATIGQNGVSQAKIFQEYTPLTGIILTKTDGTAKGGTLFALQRSLKLPIKYLGTGETFDDLHPFDPESFVASLFPAP
jgi:fused signal recognition particle receptor